MDAVVEELESIMMYPAWAGLPGVLKWGIRLGVAETVAVGVAGSRVGGSVRVRVGGGRGVLDGCSGGAGVGFAGEG